MVSEDDLADRSVWAEFTGGMRARMRLRRDIARLLPGGGVAVLEDAELLDKAADGVGMLRVSAWTPGAACAGLIVWDDPWRR